MKCIILGIRGLPARYGGFETFAEYLGRYLVSKDWEVVVYCQERGVTEVYETSWHGITRIHISVKREGPLGTIIFDFKSVLHSLKHHGVFLTLGYNTAMFNFAHRLKGKKNIINMDGVEWKRQKWGFIAKAWFWLNEWFGCWFGNQLVADHPRIEDHLSTRVSRQKITMIPYGATHITDADEKKLDEYGLIKNNYAIVIARAEPENSILEIVKAFSSSRRNAKLCVLGRYEPEINVYHKKIVDAASDEVVFVGAIYDADVVSALRFFSRFYIHGHQVGGTNPSLVEALGAGNAVLAHDNEFNRWVAKGGAVYFNDIEIADKLIGELFSSEDKINQLKEATKLNFKENFHWDDILAQYADLLTLRHP